MTDHPSLLAGWRDATFYKRPGRAEVRHIAVTEDGENYFARCAGGRHLRGERTVPLDATALRPATEVHPNGRCQRPGCRTRWPADYHDPDSTPPP